MSQEECRRFENKLAYHAAPSLLGIKCANLISLENDEFNILGQIERFNEIARRQETEDQAYVPM